MPNLKNSVSRYKMGLPKDKKSFNRNDRNKRDGGREEHRSNFLDYDYGQERIELKRSDSVHEVIQYFSEVASVMEKGFDDDSEKRNFIKNVLDQTVEKEVVLSCDRLASCCIEKLLEGCSDPFVIVRFMEAFAHNLKIVCMDPCASHVAEKLLHTCLLIVKNIDLSPEHADGEVKDNIKKACLFWAYRFGQFCYQQLDLCLSDTHGCHVFSAVLQFLGCCHINDSGLLNKKMPKKEKTFGTHIGHENSLGVKEIFPTCPIIFLDLLKNIAVAIAAHNQLCDLMFDSKSSHVIQILLSVLKKRDVKRFSQVSAALVFIIFSRRPHEVVPSALHDKSCSYLLEKVFGLSDERYQGEIWTAINEYLPQLIVHTIGNYTIQRLLFSVHSKQQFESMFDSTIEHFEKVLENHHFGIWLSIVKSCNRLKTRQVQFLTKIMQMLKCSEPIERNSYFAQLLLGFQTYEKHLEKMATATQPSTFCINLFGSLILQEILKFSKPIKAVRSILDMKSEVLMFLACHEQGCHVLISFLESEHISRRDKEKLMQKLKPVLVSVACDFSGNLTLCRMWPLLSVDQKTIIARELVEKKSSLLQHKCGVIIFKKFALFHFEHRMDTWKQIQHVSEKKQQMFKEIIS